MHIGHKNDKKTAMKGTEDSKKPTKTPIDIKIPE